jgi:hypothetical protein
MLARDWDAYLAHVHPDYVIEDRRPGPSIRVQGRDEQLATVRAAVELGVRTIRTEVLATRGDDLALTRISAGGRDGFLVESIMVIESVDDRMLRAVEFAVDDVDAAMTELDRLAARPAPNGAVRLAQITAEHHAAGRWEDMRAGLRDDFVIEDRRPGREQVLDVDQVMESTRRVHGLGLRSMRPDVVVTRGDLLAVVKVVHRVSGDDTFEDENWSCSPTASGPCGPCSSAPTTSTRPWRSSTGLPLRTASNRTAPSNGTGPGTRRSTVTGSPPR